mmetsp:Transcript_28578/g.76271  ORF Transcript_28578/g.76271 Transcript_28578/m.76271 type:complete len:747 (+) Transcript_28578:89-2329(+)
MARRLLLASLVWARGARGLSFAGDLELVQTVMSGLAENRRVSTPGREVYKHAGVPVYPRIAYGERDAREEKSWMLVLNKDATDAELQALLHELHPTALKTNPSMGELPMVEGRLSDTALQALLEKYSGRVEFVEEDQKERKIWESLDENDGPMERRAYPWNIESINANLNRGRGVGVNVYVLDTGIQTSHILFGGRAFAGVDVGSTGTFQVCAPSSTTCAADFNGHGTHCAGTVGAALYGVADGATIWAMKVLDDNGEGYTSWAILAQQWIYSSGLRPAVVSMSLGGAGTSVAEQLSIDALVADGVTVVVAGGNQNLDACGYTPANVASAITVGAYGGTSGSSSAMSPFSNYGACIDVWAPGTFILSTYIGSNDALAHGSGTSMACPHVAGLAAMMYEAHPSAASMTASQRWDLMTASNRTGWVTGLPPAGTWGGLAAVGESVNLVALAPAPTSAPTPPPTLLATSSPTLLPTPLPTTSPTPSPTPLPTALPTALPTPLPTPSPTPLPTASPTPLPTPLPTALPTALPTPLPTPSPTPLPTASQTPSPTPLQTASPTPSPTSAASAPLPSSGGVSGTGDPHLANMFGERFDLYRTGLNVLLQIPRWAGPQQTLLLLEADTRRMGGTCSDVYFQVVKISGAWTNHTDALEFFANPSEHHPSSLMWTRFGKVELKVANGKTREGIDYLNVFARNLGNTGYSVGGLLGEDDHGDASTPSSACTRQMSLLAGSLTGEVSSVWSVAEGSFS